MTIALHPYIISLEPWGSPPLSLNKRLHWAREARLKKDIGLLVKSRALRGHIPPSDHIDVWLRWQPKTKRRRDGDNVYPTIKAAVDGLVAAGIVPDDHTGHVTHRPLEILPREKGQTISRLWLCIHIPTEEGEAA